MKVLNVCVALILTCGPALPAQDLIMQMVQVPNGSGSLCDPWSCTPGQLDVVPGGPLHIITQGATFAPHLMMLGGPRSQCRPLPGFSRSLILDPPLVSFYLNLRWSKVYVSGPGPQCGGWTGFATLNLPVGIPVGTQVLTQMVAVPAIGPTSIPKFSNSILITTR